MNHAVISLGSNTPSRAEILSQAISELSPLVTRHTRPYIDHSQPYDNPYLNIVAEIETDLGYEELKLQFKELEKKNGRVAGNRDNAPVALDIDIVIFNDTVKRQRDMDSSYFRLGLSML